MPEVYNWQLGRRMSYPYEESHPDRQFAFVFNINRCIALPSARDSWAFTVRSVAIQPVCFMIVMW